MALVKRLTDSQTLILEDSSFCIRAAIGVSIDQALTAGRVEVLDNWLETH